MILKRSGFRNSEFRSLDFWHHSYLDNLLTLRSRSRIDISNPKKDFFGLPIAKDILSKAISKYFSLCLKY